MTDDLRTEARRLAEECAALGASLVSGRGHTLAEPAVLLTRVAPVLRALAAREPGPGSEGGGA